MADSSSRFMTGLLAVAVLIVIGTGVYAYSLNGQLAQLKTDIATVSKDRDENKAQLDKLTATDKTQKASLEQCTAQQSDLQAQLTAAQEAAAKAPKRRRR
jgi:septal ring factor EnvC (AmiA/AmiB activator)